MGRFIPSPGFDKRAERTPEMRALLRQSAGRAANEAERIGRQVAKSYTAEVEDVEGGVRIVATTDDINAASWIEFGNQNLPAHAPLRKGAEATGLKTRGARR